MLVVEYNLISKATRFLDATVRDGVKLKMAPGLHVIMLYGPNVAG